MILKSTSSLSRRARGFTLLELLIVLTLMAGIALLAVPAFDALLENAIIKETRHLNGVLRLLRNEAVLRRNSYRMVFELPQADWHTERITNEGRIEVLNDSKYLRPRSLPRGMQLVKMKILSQRVLGDTGVVHIDPSGFSDSFQLWVDYRGEHYLLKSKGFTSGIDLLNADDADDADDAE